MPDRISSFEALYQRLDKTPPLAIAVSSPEDETVLQALSTAVHREWIKPILVGQQDKLELLLERLKLNPGHFEIEDTQPGSTAARAVEIVRSGDAHLLMKGKTPTAELLRAVLNQEHGLVQSIKRMEGETEELQPRLLTPMAE
jgi:phosphate butyryltransferase